MKIPFEYIGVLQQENTILKRKLSILNQVSALTSFKGNIRS